MCFHKRNSQVWYTINSGFAVISYVDKASTLHTKQCNEYILSSLNLTGDVKGI